MNFFMFVLAFFCQWGIGGIIQSFEPEPDGGYSLAAHATALWIMIGAQALCYLNFVRGAGKKNKNG